MKRARVQDLRGVAQPRRAVATEGIMFPSPRTECASVEQTMRTQAEHCADVLTAEIESRSQAVDLEGHTFLGDLEHALEIEGRSRPSA